tara:strand:+ start:15 stop:167 length:153 start_codon:yes stop_codon:yes gene_type:complete
MGQFMGWASYDLKTICVHCGETGPREDMEDHHCEEMDDEEDEDEEESEEA